MNCKLSGLTRNTDGIIKLQIFTVETNDIIIVPRKRYTHFRQSTITIKVRSSNVFAIVYVNKSNKPSANSDRPDPVAVTISFDALTQQVHIPWPYAVRNAYKINTNMFVIQLTTIFCLI